MAQHDAFDQYDAPAIRQYIYEMAAELAGMATDIGDLRLAERLQDLAQSRPDLTGGIKPRPVSAPLRRDLD
jgi:hypothetical protein